MTRILWTTTLILLFIISLFNCGMSFAAKRYPIPIQISGAPCYGMVVESYGEGSQKYWIFRPAAPGKYPVVVFLHGWAATEPLFYMAWIRHLVREGNIVVYPRYQNLLDLNSEKFTDNAANSIKDALKKLKGKYDGRFYIVGHSAGGLIAVNLAARDDIPKPSAVLAIQPGVSENGSKLQNLSRIPSDVLLVVMAGDSDNITGTGDSYLIMDETPQIPSERKIFLLVQSDGNLRADHLSPLAISDEYGILVDNLDYSGYWKVLDILMKLSENNKTISDADMDELLGMGNWSDGTPIKKMKIMS